MRRVIGFAVLVAIAAPAAGLHAQRPQTRRGFWIGFGWGVGSAAASCDSCTNTSRESALSGYLKMGGTLRPNLLLGGESNGFVTSGRHRQRANLSVALYYYPMPERGLFVKGGVGASFFLTKGMSPDFRGIGPGFTAGVGYDARVGRNVSITPVINLFAGSPKLKRPGYSLPGSYRQNVIQFAVGITIH